MYYAFDVLHIEGRNLTGEALTKRRALLPKIVGKGGTIRLSQDLPGTAADVVAAVGGIGGEGVIAKRKVSTYQPGDRSGDWVKLKLEKQQEFVIGGYRPDGSDSLDALLVGYYAGRKLLFAGKVRAGFIPPVRREVVRKLKPLGPTSAHSQICPPTRNRAGVPASPLRKCMRCSGQSLSSSRISGSLSSPPKAAYGTPHSLGCARTKRRER